VVRVGLTEDEISRWCSRAAQGGPQGLEDFEKLVRAFQAPLRTYLTTHAPESDLAYDLAQETFVTAWKRMPDFEPDRPFWPWLVGIARGLLRNTWRTLSRERMFKQRLTMRYLVEAEAANREDDDPVRLEPFLRFLTECLKELPARLQDLVRMYYEEKLNSAEIGRQVSSPSGTVRYELSRVRDILRLCVKRRTEAALL
jgi:RNA polymerase sigma-70 factor (ECF subfamily)